MYRVESKIHPNALGLTSYSLEASLPEMRLLDIQMSLGLAQIQAVIVRWGIDLIFFLLDFISPSSLEEYISFI